MANILTVEDEALVRILLVETLETVGHSVSEAPDGEAALKMIQAGVPVDVLVTDIRMPKMEGYSLAMAARALRPALPVIFMTGYSDSKPPEALAESRVLRKPFNPDSLVALIDTLLAGKA